MGSYWQWIKDAVQESGGGALRGLAKGFNATEGSRKRMLLPREGTVERGQNNASGSNAPLDKSLGGDARKIAGISEGGSTPQLQGVTSLLGNGSPAGDSAGSLTSLGSKEGAASAGKGLFDLISSFWG